MNTIKITKNLYDLTSEQTHKILDLYLVDKTTIEKICKITKLSKEKIHNILLYNEVEREKGDLKSYKYLCLKAYRKSPGEYLVAQWNFLNEEDKEKQNIRKEKFYKNKQLA
jgi:hypothetical protein